MQTEYQLSGQQQSAESANVCEPTVTYDNLGLLGTGSFSEVFKIRDPETQRLFAMKRSVKEMKTEKTLNDALAEVAVMKKLNAKCDQRVRSTAPIMSMVSDGDDHSDGDDEKEAMASVNICRFHRHWINVEGRLFQIFEFCEHGTLRQLIDGNDMFSPLQTLQCVRQICCGLEIVHSAHIIHLDLKPENILVSSNRVLKICDFGISIDDDGDCRDADSKFEFSGDPLYIAPEILQNLNHVLSDDINDRTDIFSLGIIFLEMLCGVLLSKMKRKGETLRKIRNGEVDFDGIIIDKFSNCKAHYVLKARPAEKEMRSLCRRMLRNASSLRPSAIEVRSDIDCVVSQLSRSANMRGIRALSLHQTTPPHTSSPIASSKATKFTTPSASASRREFKQRREQRCFAETPFRSYADVQLSIEGAPYQRSQMRAHGINAHFSPISLHRTAMFSPTSSASGSNYTPARANRSLDFISAKSTPISAHSTPRSYSPPIANGLTFLEMLAKDDCSPDMFLDTHEGDGAEFELSLPFRGNGNDSDSNSNSCSNSAVSADSAQLQILRGRNLLASLGRTPQRVHPGLVLNFGADNDIDKRQTPDRPHPGLVLDFGAADSDIDIDTKVETSKASASTDINITSMTPSAEQISDQSDVDTHSIGPILATVCHGDEDTEIKVLRVLIERQEKRISEGDKSVEREILWANVHRLQTLIRERGGDPMESNEMLFEVCAQLTSPPPSSRGATAWRSRTHSYSSSGGAQKTLLTTPSPVRRPQRSQSTDRVRRRSRKVMRSIMEVDQENNDEDGDDDDEDGEDREEEKEEEELEQEGCQWVWDE